MSKRFKKQNIEIADVFVRCGGDLNATEYSLQKQAAQRGGAPPVQARQFYTEWSHTEDLVLINEAISETQDYQVLLQTKGKEECGKRRLFLQAATNILTVTN